MKEKNQPWLWISIIYTKKVIIIQNSNIDPIQPKKLSVQFLNEIEKNNLKFFGNHSFPVQPKQPQRKEYCLTNLHPKFLMVQNHRNEIILILIKKQTHGSSIIRHKNQFIPLQPPGFRQTSQKYTLEERQRGGTSDFLLHPSPHIA